MTRNTKQHTRPRASGMVDGEAAQSAEGGGGGEFINMMQDICTVSDAWGGLPGSNAIDGSMATRWSSGNGTMPHWIKRNMRKKARVIQYRLANYTGNDDIPNTWELQGSNDDTNWDTLHSVTNDPLLAGQFKTYTVTSPGLYYYYRLYFTASSDGWISLGEWEMSVD